MANVREVFFEWHDKCVPDVKQILSSNKDLTMRQKLIIFSFAHFFKAGSAPSYKEIAESIGMPMPGVWTDCHNLQDIGLLKKLRYYRISDDAKIIHQE